MEFITELWMPIVIASIVVFFASFVAWMVLPHHKKDVQPLPDERRFVEALEPMNIPSGLYMWPNCNSAAEMKSDEFKAKMDAGPWGSMTVVGGKPNMACNLITVMLFYVILNIGVAYVCWHALAPGADYLAVFRIAGAVAIIGYCAGAIPNAIFFSKPGRFVFTDFVDGLAYGLLTAGVFGWLWPAAAAMPSVG